MKKSYFKRGTSALLALIMCLTAMIGFGSTTAFAAGEEAEVAMFTFPRDGDANYGADWGHEAKHYMNGWTAGEVKGNTVYAVGSWDGNACYCIEPGTPLAIGDRLVQKDESYWDNFPWMQKSFRMLSLRRSWYGKPLSVSVTQISDTLTPAAMTLF